MDDLKAGLDPRAYNFRSIDACEGALWRSHKCKAHNDGYEDIVSFMFTTRNVEELLRPCCMEPYNEAAREELAWWTANKDTPEGAAIMKQSDETAAELLRNIRTTI